MTVITRSQQKKINDQKKKVIETDALRVIDVVRNNWKHSQTCAHQAIEKIHSLEDDLKNKTKTIITLENKNRILVEKTNRQCNTIQSMNRSVNELQKILNDESNRYSDLYERYQEVVHAANNEIETLQNTNEEQATKLFKLEQEIENYEQKLCDHENLKCAHLEMVDVINNTLKPITNFVTEIKTEAICKMKRALTNMLGVQMESLEDYKNQLSKDKRNKRQVPDEFICAISGGIMKDPVLTSSGEIFDRSSIQNWINVQKHSHSGQDHCNYTSPLTRRSITDVFYPHESLQKQIVAFQQENKQKDYAQLLQVFHNLRKIK